MSPPTPTGVSLDVATVSVVGQAVIAPGVAHPSRLQGLYTPTATPDEAATILGRKGLLGKNDATRLALCAVHRALGYPVGIRPQPELDPTTAVVGGGALTNADSVARLARQVAAVDDSISVMDAPNASGNVLASAVALRFRLGGPCLMITSGRWSADQALRIALLMLATERARRVVVVGAQALSNEMRPLVDFDVSPAAACVVLAKDVTPTSPRLDDLTELEPATQVPGSRHSGISSLIAMAERAEQSAQEGRSVVLAPAWKSSIGSTR